MKAAVHYSFGEPDAVTVTDLPDPTCPKKGCVVRVKACSVNPADWKYIHGNWKWVTGNRFPRQIGADFAGVIDYRGARRLLRRNGEFILLELNGRLRLFAVAFLSGFIEWRKVQ